MKKRRIGILIVVAALMMAILASCTPGLTETKDPDPIETQDPVETQDPDNNNEDEDKEEDKGSSKVEMTLSEIIEAIYGIKDPGLMLGDMEIDLENPDNVKYYTGLTEFENVEQAIASETMIGSQAYSLVMLRVKDAKFAKDIAQDIFKNVDVRKWICVGANDMQVVAKDDVVMLFMTQSFEDGLTSKEAVEAFEEILGTADVVFK